MVTLWLDCYRSRATRLRYAYDARLLMAFIGKPLRLMTLGDVQAFAASLAHLKPASIAGHLSGVKSLVKFGHRLGYLQFDVAAPIELPAIKDNLAARILTEAQVQRLLYVERDPRKAALLRLIYGAGLRISEACGLTWGDLSPRDDSGQATVLGKGGKTRVILLPAPLWERIVALRGEAGPDDPIFHTRTNRPLSKVLVGRIMKRAARRAGLAKNVSTHWLRHAHASHALDRNCPVHVLQATLGHASLTATTRYSHVRPGDSSARYLPS